MTGLASPQSSTALTDRSHGERSSARNSRTHSYAEPVRCLRSQNSRNQSGFTILDIIIVITLVSLLAGITFPQIGKMQMRFAVRGYVNTFMSTHSMARTAAVRQGRVRAHVREESVAVSRIRRCPDQARRAGAVPANP